jgi:hypothetical protein
MHISIYMHLSGFSELFIRNIVEDYHYKINYFHIG